jgi:small subunit ribosomal protein S1
MVPPVEPDAAAEDRASGASAEAEPKAPEITASAPTEPETTAPAPTEPEAAVPEQAGPGPVAAAPEAAPVVQEAPQGGSDTAEATPATPATEVDKPEAAAPAAAPAKPPANARALLREAAKTGASVTGKVVAIVRGGYEVDVDGIICLCPFSQIELTPPRDQLVHARQTYEFKVSSIRGKKVSLSRRRILEKEARKAERKKLAAVKAGSELDGTVVSLNDYGAFVDIGGVQGMVHVSEITHARIAKPKDKLKVGEKVRVQVLKPGKRRGRLALSMKALEGDPWKEVGKTLQANTIIEGRLLRLTEFGAFVEVAPGVDGLIHVSEIPAGEKDNYEKMAAEQAVRPVHVLKVEAGKRRISLAPAPDGLNVGDKVVLSDLRAGKLVKVVVAKVDKSGLLVKIGQAQTGLIPPNETGTPRGADLARSFKEGQEIQALVMRQERGDRRIRLSIRRADRQEERKQLDDFRKSASSASGSFATLGDIFKKVSQD